MLCAVEMSYDDSGSGVKRCLSEEDEEEDRDATRHFKDTGAGRKVCISVVPILRIAADRWNRGLPREKSCCEFYWEKVGDHVITCWARIARTSWNEWS